MRPAPAWPQEDSTAFLSERSSSVASRRSPRVIERKLLLQLARLSERFLKDPPIEFVKAGRINAVGRALAVGIELLMAQAQQLDEIESIHHRPYIVGA